ncbi:intraflagellar transport protein 57 homolog [Drosophila bipectinata]|uniref:intraflagellar transport protein 57 homolog n=1 Tax=Drosophila bipectinata TaxID=42026 RepID=UPI001C8933E2|nr:intraflagellar transport protein 57 homolog [Drosophila bipectinata]
MQQEESQEKAQQLLNFQSDDLLEKLKLLNYEKHLLKEFKLKPLSRFYFVKATNPGEQFYMFTLICWWLCKKLGKDMERPQEYDDPNTVAAKIIQILEQIDVPVDFQPNKLIRGAGPICLMVLDVLSTQACKVAKVAYQKLHIAQEEEFLGDYLEDNAEIILEKLEDEQNAAAPSDDSDMELETHNFRQLNWLNRPQKRSIGDVNLDERNCELDARMTDHQEWRLELERVLPHLKVFVKADARDWRTHISQMETFRAAIDEVSETTQAQLKKLHNEFTFDLEKIESREKHLNNELQPLIQQFKEQSIELSSIQYAQNQVQEETEKQTTQLNEVMLEQELKKEEMERRGQVMSDGSSVQQIKKSIAKLKEDIAQLNLEVALLVHAHDQDIVVRQLSRDQTTDLANNP